MEHNKRIKFALKFKYRETVFNANTIVSNFIFVQVYLKE